MDETVYEEITDIGCGMVAQRTSLDASALPDGLEDLRREIERAVPHGGGKGSLGGWREAPKRVGRAWRGLSDAYADIVDRHDKVAHRRPVEQLGTLGSGNHRPSGSRPPPSTATTTTWRASTTSAETCCSRARGR